MDWRYNDRTKRTDPQPYTYREEGDDEDNGRPPSPKSPPSSAASMSSWLQRTASSTQAQFAATAVLAGAVTAGAILGYQHLRRQERVEDLKSSIPELGRGHTADKVGFLFTLAGDEVSESGKSKKG